MGLKEIAGPFSIGEAVIIKQSLRGDFLDKEFRVGEKIVSVSGITVVPYPRKDYEQYNFLYFCSLKNWRGMELFASFVDSYAGDEFTIVAQCEVHSATALNIVPVNVEECRILGFRVFTFDLSALT